MYDEMKCINYLKNKVLLRNNYEISNIYKFNFNLFGINTILK